MPAGLQERRNIRIPERRMPTRLSMTGSGLLITVPAAVPIRPALRISLKPPPPFRVPTRERTRQRNGQPKRKKRTTACSPISATPARWITAVRRERALTTAADSSKTAKRTSGILRSPKRRVSSAGCSARKKNRTGRSNPREVFLQGTPQYVLQKNRG